MTNYHNAKWRKYNDLRLMDVRHNAEDDGDWELVDAIDEEFQLRADERPLDWSERV